MRVDLLHAQASIDWSVAQLPSFQSRLNAWLDLNIEAGIIDFDQNSPDWFVVAIEKAPLPLEFLVEAGVYINAIRSALDILATSLANRFSLANPKDVYFPIAVSETIFRSRGYKGSDFVQALPARERSILEALKPYQGGNAVLWALHQLDIMRKHRRLLSIVYFPASIRFRGIADFRPTAKPVPIDDKTILGFVRKSAINYDMQISADIAFDEACVGPQKPLVPVLNELARYASGIIKMFDVP
jgi:hypothetical protein